MEDDLHHLIKSLNSMPYYAIMTPAAGRKCGIVFLKDKLRKPGKSPRCNGSSIIQPLINIEDRI